jgi:hypothetical protein
MNPDFLDRLLGRHPSGTRKWPKSTRIELAPLLPADVLETQAPKEVAQWNCEHCCATGDILWLRLARM